MRHPRGPWLGSRSKRENKKKKNEPEKRRNKRSIIKYAHISEKGWRGRELRGGGFSAAAATAAAGRERKEFPSTTSGPDFILRQKRWNLCASRLPCRRRSEEYDMHFFLLFFFFCPTGTHKSHKRTRERARLYIFIHYTHTRDEF